MVKNDPENNSECESSDHSEHLCYIISQGFHLDKRDEYADMVKDAQFVCEHCGRIANSGKYLCKPMKLE